MLRLGALIILLICATNTAGQCDQRQFLNSTCEPYGAYHKVTAKGVCDCQDACDKDARCNHFVLNAHQEQDNCHFKATTIDKAKLQNGSCSIGPSTDPPSPPPSPPTPAPLGPPADAKNVLFFVVDDLRNELGFTDARKGIITPNLDALAAKSLVFDRAYVQQGVCSPSRNSFLSGRRPDTTKIWNFKESFRITLGNRIHSLPGAFKANGYLSTGMGKVYHPGHPENDDADLSWSLDHWPYFHATNFASKIADLPDNRFQDGMIKDMAVTRLGQLKNMSGVAKAAGKTPAPFFLAVGFHKPHIPWIMPQKFLDMQIAANKTDLPLHPTGPQFGCNVSYYKCENIEKDPKGPVGPFHPLPNLQIQTNRQHYRAAMSWTDYLVGEVLKALESNGFADNTVVSFLGDHGWQLGEHGMWCKQSNFDLVARIPMMIHVPWMPTSQGQRTQGFAEAVDLMPTLLDLAGVTSDPAHPPAARVWDMAQLEGVSLRPLLMDPLLSDKGANEWKNATFTQYPRCKGSQGKEPWEAPTDNACTSDESSNFSAMGHSIRSDTYRYTLWTKWDGEKLEPIWSEVVGEELYDHSGDTGFDTDAMENVNLASEAAAGGNATLAEARTRLKAALLAGFKGALPTKQTA